MRAFGWWWISGMCLCVQGFERGGGFVSRMVRSLLFLDHGCHLDSRGTGGGPSVARAPRRGHPGSARPGVGRRGGHSWSPRPSAPGLLALCTARSRSLYLLVGSLSPRARPLKSRWGLTRPPCLLPRPPPQQPPLPQPPQPPPPLPGPH